MLLPCNSIMDPFQPSGYEVLRTDSSEEYSSDPNDGNSSLWDLDSQVHTPRITTSTTCNYELARKTCNFGDENNEIDGTGWTHKPIRNWCQEETINWLMSAASYIRQPYNMIQHSLALPGCELVSLTRSEFIDRDPTYGDLLYDLLHSQENLNLPSFETIHGHFEDEYRPLNSNSTSDAESETSIQVSLNKRPPGRPPKPPRPSKTSQGKLWEFIRQLLHNPDTCPRLICWENYPQAKFRFVKTEEVARLWGSRKGNTRMTFDKLSRAMRYYYKREVLLPVLGKRLVYKFGPNATGWQTDNPNFRC